MRMCRGPDHQPTSIEEKRAEEEAIQGVKAHFLGLLHSYLASTENLDPNIHSFLTCLESNLQNGNGVQVRDLWAIANLLGIQIRCQMKEDWGRQQQLVNSSEIVEILGDAIYGPPCRPLSLRVFHTIAYHHDATRLLQYHLLFPDSAGTVRLPLDTEVSHATSPTLLPQPSVKDEEPAPQTLTSIPETLPMRQDLAKYEVKGRTAEGGGREKHCACKKTQIIEKNVYIGRTSIKVNAKAEAPTYLPMVDCTCKQTCIHTYVRTCIHTYVHMYTHTCVITHLSFDPT